jgi:hypothetical protein
MNRLIALFLTLLIEVSLLYSQAEYLPGFIIMNNGDTVKGNIYLGATKTNCEKCQFKLANTNDIETFLPGELGSYKFTNGLFYRSHEIDIDGGIKKVFLEWAVKGSMNLYFYISPKSGMHYYVERGDTGFIELRNTSKEFIGSDNTRRTIEGKEYATELASLIRDQPALLPKIYSSKFDSKSLIKLSRDYHNLVCPNEQCQIFERPKRKLIIYAGLVTGFIHSSLYIKTTSNYQSVIDAFNTFKIKPANSYEAGAFVSISNLDFTSPRISLLSELTYSHLNYQLDNYGTIYDFGRIKFVELIKYCFMIGRFRPSMSAGPAIDYRTDAHNYSKYVIIPPNYQVYMPFDQFLKNYIPGVNGQLGIDYILSEEITIGLNGRYEYYGHFRGSVDENSYTQNINLLLGLSYKLK